MVTEICSVLLRQFFSLHTVYSIMLKKFFYQMSIWFLFPALPLYAHSSGDINPTLESDIVDATVTLIKYTELFRDNCE